jgi:hypothetical protein
VVVTAIFAAICLGVAITGFSSLSEITDPAEMADAKGFAWFWTFLGSIAIAAGLLGWWLARNSESEDDA